MEKKPSKLVNGLIPAKTECPFRADQTCPMSRTYGHRGEEHPQDFSCGAARFWDMMHRNGQELKPC